MKITGDIMRIVYAYVCGDIIHIIRTLAPYTAKHLDWYVDPDNVSPDQAYYMEHASNNNHWSRWNG